MLRKVLLKVLPKRHADVLQERIGNGIHNARREWLYKRAYGLESGEPHESHGAHSAGREIFGCDIGPLWLYTDKLQVVIIGRSKHLDGQCGP